MNSENTDTVSTPSVTDQKKKGGFFSNLLFNIIIPTIILSKFSSDEYLGPMYSIVVALSFPVAYGIKDFIAEKKANFFSVIGVISVVLTGGMSLLQLDPEYIAIKEAAVPAIFGLVTLFSLKTRYPLVKTFLFNEQIMKVDLVNESIQKQNKQEEFNQKLVNATYMVAGSFALSSFLNYALAKYILVSPPGTTAFTEELGKMTALSFPVIALPCTIVLMGALWYLLHHIQKLSQLTMEDIFHQQ